MINDSLLITAKEAAISVLHQASTPNGFLASAEKTDNYARIWSRDSMMTGIAAVLYQDTKLIDAFRQSILTLAKYQNEQGQIPSNVGFEANGQVKISYGGLVGRVDSLTWWVIGAGIYLNNVKDNDLKAALFPKVKKVFEVLKVYEFNGRGLMYVPLGANWADEYVTQGYTLYDQLLRIWALRSAAKVWEIEEWNTQAQALTLLIQTNYYHQPVNTQGLYHPTAYQKANPQPYWYSSLSPAGYDERWDMPANALALLLGIGTKIQNDELHTFLLSFRKKMTHWFLPVYAPTIFPEDNDWLLLKENYSYHFKNYPNHFHNGGAWLIFLGWLGLGLNLHDFKSTAFEILKDAIYLLQTEQPQPFSFYEYWNPETLQHGGTPKLCFSATGFLFLLTASNSSETVKIKETLLC